MAGSVVGQLLESLTIGRLFAGVILIVLGSVVLDFFTTPQYPRSIPKLGYQGTGPLTAVKNAIGYATSYRDWIKEGYEKHAKHGRSFVVPNAGNRPDDLVVPRSQVMWLLEQPDNVVSTHLAHEMILHIRYNFLSKQIGEDNDMWHAKVIHRYLARHLNTLIPGIEDASVKVTDKTFGMDTENWTRLKVWDAWMSIVPGITNFILVGQPLCENEELLKCMVHFVEHVVLNGFILNMVPRFLHPIVGRLITIPNWWYWRKGARYTLPLIKQRLHDIERHEAGDPAYASWVAPEDFITWNIKLCKQERNRIEIDLETMSKRIMPIQFAALHTTVLTGHGVLLDLVHADPSVIESIREEVARVLDEEGGHWTKNGLARLYRLDSAIRESQRYSNMASTLIERKVIAKEGITNAVEGWHVPYGTMFALNMQGLHHDPAHYENPDTYDAFRFSRPREEYEARPQEEKSADEALRFKKLGMVTTSETHIAFGHGRHACPGRFFVAHELKMVLAHLLLNYEVRKTVAERPRPTYVGHHIIPSQTAAVEVRRLKTRWVPES